MRSTIQAIDVMHQPDYLDLPAVLYAGVQPQAATSPRLIKYNASLAKALQLADANEKFLALNYSGNPTVTGIAMAYAGHQFGQLVPQLGDGRALLLGDAVAKDGQRFEIQLKGAGRTPFSRGGDGRAALGPALREYLVSEAMAARGIATTRALALVATGDTVLRDRILPGAVVTRVSRAHLRVGTFYFAALRRDETSLQALTEFAWRRLRLAGKAEPLALFAAVVRAQAELVAQWMAAGFIHGVMNTDNISIVGETLDYGPCAFLDEYRSDKVFSSIDHYGRYAYGEQPNIAQWNLARLAESLLVLDDRQDTYLAELERFADHYETTYLALMAAKFGFASVPADCRELVELFLSELEQHGADYHLGLLDLAAKLDTISEENSGTFSEILTTRLEQECVPLIEAQATMGRSTPQIIPRNHQVERAIAAAESGDFSVFEQLHDALSRPFERPTDPALAAPPADAERVTATFCGT